MASAEVGDEQRRRDPTTRELEERVAELLGHEAALFLPSGTMCNEIAFRVHARPGDDEVILDRTSHPVNAEAGGPAQLAGLMIRTLNGEGGNFTAEQLEAAVRSTGSRYEPRSRLVSVEQTTNLAGGRVWPQEAIRAVLDVADRDGSGPISTAPGCSMPSSPPAWRTASMRAGSTRRGSISRRGSGRRSARCWRVRAS